MPLAMLVLWAMLSRVGTAQPPAASSSIADARLTRTLDSLVTAAYPPGRPGAAVIVVRAGQVLLRRAYGMASLELQVPNRVDMPFEIGSLTKQFTAAAILHLEQEGRLSLSADIRHYLPELPEFPRVITVEHLLTHTSGLRNFTELEAWRPLERLDVPTSRIVSLITANPPTFPAGERFAYSNSGYFLLALIVDRVSGMPYEQYLQERILAPAGMRRSGVGDKAQVVPNRASGYSRRHGEDVNAEFLALVHARGTGSLMSTVDDLASWDRALDGTAILGTSAKQRMWRAFELADGSRAPYGFGWFIGDVAGRPAVQHGGLISGYASAAIRVHEPRIFVAVLSNTDAGDVEPFLLARSLATRILAPR